MKRIPEPELMTECEQVKAYAEADFSEPHQQFVDLIRQSSPGGLTGPALDLGCGSGDISIRFARFFPDCPITAVDGSKEMLKYAKLYADRQGMAGIEFVLARIPGDALPDRQYGVIYSNSLLHHLPDGQVLWSAVKQYGQQGTEVFIMDLIRPENLAQARTMTRQYAAGEPEILQRDFYHSLLAAFTPDEIATQLASAGLDFSLRLISDRHVFIHGVL